MQVFAAISHTGYETAFQGKRLANRPVIDAGSAPPLQLAKGAVGSVVEAALEESGQCTLTPSLSSRAHGVGQYGRRVFTLMGAPLDSSGSGRGESRAPAALRHAGLAERLDGRDLGEVTPPITDSTRDLQSGVIGLAELRERSLTLADAVARTLGRGERPLVLGGDCCVLLGVFVGLRRADREAGLWFVDGHADFYDGHTSPSGEAARSRSLGRSILSALEEEARRLGYRRVRLDTGPRQPHARALYRSAGYAAIFAYNRNPYATYWGQKRL